MICLNARIVFQYEDASNSERRLKNSTMTEKAPVFSSGTKRLSCLWAHCRKKRSGRKASLHQHRLGISTAVLPVRKIDDYCIRELHHGTVRGLFHI